MSLRALGTNAAWALFSHLFARGSLVIASIFLARELTTQSFAAYSYFQLTVSMLAAYASVGLGVTASRYFAEVGHTKPGQARPPLGILCILSLAASGLAFMTVMLLPSSWVAAGLDVPRWLLAVGVAATALGVIPDGAVLGLERYRQATIVSIAAGALMLLMAWWAVCRQKADVAMWGIVLAALVQAVGQSAIAVRVAGWESFRIKAEARAKDIRRIFDFAGPMLLVSLISASGTWLVGRVILHAGNGQLAFALYSIGLQWFGLALVLPGMVSRVVLPRMVRTSRDAGGWTEKRLVRSGAWLAMAAAAAVAAVGAIFGPYLMLLYGANYQPGRWFIAAFMGAAILCAPANTLGNAIVARDGQRAWLTVTLVWLVVLMTVAVLGSGLGAWSGALALGVAAFVLAGSGLFVTRRRSLV